MLGKIYFYDSLLLVERKKYVRMAIPVGFKHVHLDEVGEIHVEHLGVGMMKVDVNPSFQK